MPYHVEYKVEILCEIMASGLVDGRDRAMLESILLDHKEYSFRAGRAWS